MDNSREGAQYTSLPIHAVEPVRPLTPGQEEVVDLLAKGWRYQGIAQELGISVRTVHDRVNEVVRLLPYPAEENVSRKEHVMLWAVHRVWHKYMRGSGRVYASTPEPSEA